MTTHASKKIHPRLKIATAASTSLASVAKTATAEATTVATPRVTTVTTATAGATTAEKVAGATRISAAAVIILIFTVFSVRPLLAQEQKSASSSESKQEQQEQKQQSPANKKLSAPAVEKKIIIPVTIKKDSKISILLKNPSFLGTNFAIATQKTVEKILKNLPKSETFPPAEYKNSIKWSSKRPLSLKLYRKTKDKNSLANKRLQQAYSYLKKKDFLSFHTIISDIILRHHFSSISAQAAFTAAWSLMVRDPKNPYRYFEEATYFFDYLVNAHRYSKYSDGSLMLLLPWLMKKDLKTAQMLLEKYIHLQGKIETMRWSEEWDVEEEADNVFVSTRKSQKIINLFFDSVITLAQIEQQQIHKTKQNWKKRRSVRKIRQYLHYLQQFFKKKQQ